METEPNLEPNQTLYINNINEKIDKKILKNSLYMIFSQFGKIVEIVACKGLKLRGQAWVCYQDVTVATAAMKTRQGFNFYGKPLRISYAKSKSDVVARKDGTFIPRPKKEREEPDKKKRGLDEEESSAVRQPAPKAPKLVVNNIPHRILFAQALPDDCNEQVLKTLFAQYAGFQEVRMVPGKKGIAFIEFQDMMQAGVALQQLSGFNITPNDKLHLTYGNQ